MASQPSSRRTGRRDFLAACTALTAAATTRHVRAGVEQEGAASLFLAARLHDARHEAVLLDHRGHDVGVLALPDRGHSFAIDAPRRRAVIFGRQPGFHATVFSLPDCAALQSLPLPEGRHYFGHGAFSADGMYLFATENDFDAGRGVLGVYHARPGRTWQRVAEFDTGGIGPHEVVLMPDGRTLCVANGGLLTHPDFGKEPLNLATMRPSLAYLDARDGRIVERIELAPELFQLSIRHLCIDGSGAVWFACQHQGAALEQPPLLGRHRPGQPAQLFAAPPDIQRDLRNYVGSIAADVEGGIIATSSPVGGHVAFWDATTGQCLGSMARPDGCGVASLGDARFLVSDGFGALAAAKPGEAIHELVRGTREMSWDNHLRRV